MSEANSLCLFRVLSRLKFGQRDGMVAKYIPLQNRSRDVRVLAGLNLTLVPLNIAAGTAQGYKLTKSLIPHADLICIDIMANLAHGVCDSSKCPGIEDMSYPNPLQKRPTPALYRSKVGSKSPP